MERGGNPAVRESAESLKRGGTGDTRQEDTDVKSLPFRRVDRNNPPNCFVTSACSPLPFFRFLIPSEMLGDLIVLPLAGPLIVGIQVEKSRQSRSCIFDSQCKGSWFFPVHNRLLAW